jgi:hypothetical protein
MKLEKIRILKNSEKLNLYLHSVFLSPMIKYQDTVQEIILNRKCK